jgi:hypothetical protein
VFIPEGNNPMQRSEYPPFPFDLTMGEKLTGYVNDLKSVISAELIKLHSGMAVRG